jgi:hypothetical protein
VTSKPLTAKKMQLFAVPLPKSMTLQSLILLVLTKDNNPSLGPISHGARKYLYNKLLINFIIAVFF